MFSVAVFVQGRTVLYILTKNVSSLCQIISYIDIILLNFLNLSQVKENQY